MNWAYLQFETTTYAQARIMARLLEVPEAHGVGLVVALHRWAITRAPEGDFSGTIHAKAPREMVALALHWPTADAPRLWDALERFGFVQSADAHGNTHGTDRVCGLSLHAVEPAEAA